MSDCGKGLALSTVSRSMQSLFEPGRLRRWGGALAASVVVATVVVVASGDGPWGDYNVFHVAGGMALEDIHEIIDPAARSVRMREFYPNSEAPFSYPPLVAYIYAPLAMLPVDVGYLGSAAVMACAAGWATWMLTDLLAVETRVWRHVAVLGVLTFPPFLRSMLGGQNSALTLLFLVGGWLLRDRGHPLAAGTVLGLLWFKPHIAVPVFLLLAAAQWWRSMSGMALVGVAGYLAHSGVFGVRWGLTWASDAVRLRGDAIGMAQGVGKTISPVQYVRDSIAGPGGDLLGLGLAAVLAIGFAVLMFVRRSPADRLAITCLALMLTGPHMLAYEATLLVPVIAVILVRSGTNSLPPVLAYWFVGYLSWLPGLALLRIAYVLVGGLWWWSTVDTSPRRSAPALQ